MFVGKDRREGGEGGGGRRGERGGRGGEGMRGGGGDEGGREGEAHVGIWEKGTYTLDSAIELTAS